MTIHAIEPKFGVNYDVGYVGFTSRTDDLVAGGIAWFERWDEVQPAKAGTPSAVPLGICVEHALIVSGENRCIEAHAGSGVSRSTLSKYFEDPHCRIFFRKPVNWSPALGAAIMKTAAGHIGDKYGYGVIVADLLANTWLGHWVNKCTGNWPNRIVLRLLNRAGAEVCSQLVAMALKANVPNAGCLAEPAQMITPQALFEDPLVFEPWRNASWLSTDFNPS